MSLSFRGDRDLTGRRLRQNSTSRPFLKVTLVGNFHSSMPFTAEETSLCKGIQEAQIKSWNAIVFPGKVVDAILNANVLEKDVFDHGLHISLQRAIKFANELPQFRTHSTC